MRSTNQARPKHPHPPLLSTPLGPRPRPKPQVSILHQPHPLPRLCASIHVTSVSLSVTQSPLPHATPLNKSDSFPAAQLSNCITTSLSNVSYCRTLMSNDTWWSQTISNSFLSISLSCPKSPTVLHVVWPALNSPLQ